MARKAKAKRKRAPKTILKRPDLEQSKSAVLNSLTSPSSQRSYGSHAAQSVTASPNPPGRNAIVAERPTRIVKSLAAVASEPKPPSQWNDSFVRGGTATAVRVPSALPYGSVMLWQSSGCVFLPKGPLI